MAIAASGGRAERAGRKLSLVLSSGARATFDDQPCSDGNETACRQFRLVADLPSRHFFVVSQAFYEGGTKLLIDDRTGRQFELCGLPHFEPDGERFLVINEDYEHDCGPQLQIWQRRGSGAAVEWQGSPMGEGGNWFSRGCPDRDETLVDFVRWDEQGILLRIETQQPERSWPATLRREGAAWRFEATWPC